MALWTKDEISLAQVMTNRGAAFKDIAAKLGRSEAGVAKKLASVAGRSNPHAMRSTPETDATIIRMRGEGRPFSAVALHIGRSTGWVEKRCRYLQLVNPNARAEAGRRALAAMNENAVQKPQGYDAKTAKWALGNWRTDEEARLVAVHLGLSGDKRGKAVIQALRAAMAMQAAA